MRKAFLLVCILISVAQTIKAQDVFKTPSGRKYHLPSCKMVENFSEKITLQKAIELGLEPCKICKPNNNSLNSAASSLKKANGESFTTRCMGFTKAGARCNHMTKIANGYCFQHQPK